MLNGLLGLILRFRPISSSGRFRDAKLVLVSIWLAVSLPACVETQTQLQTPEHALRECQASNPYSEGEEHQKYVDYERDCYSKYNETKEGPR
jgi:hypothetical protein